MFNAKANWMRMLRRALRTRNFFNAAQPIAIKFFSDGRGAKNCFIWIHQLQAWPAEVKESVTVHSPFGWLDSGRGVQGHKGLNIYSGWLGPHPEKVFSKREGGEEGWTIGSQA